MTSTIPVFRWARGQRLSQNLLSLQLPLYEQIMEKAPSSLHTLIASGDVIDTLHTLDRIVESQLTVFERTKNKSAAELVEIITHPHGICLLYTSRCV